MKKTILSVLLVTMSLFVLAGCGDTKKDDGGSKLPIGTYQVTFFGSKVTDAAGNPVPLFSMFYITNSCSQATTLFPGEINKDNGAGVVINGCTADSQVTLVQGLVSIELKDDGKAYVTSKMAMKGGAVEVSVADKYQYTIYTPFVYSDNVTTFTGTGVSGYNYDAATNAPSATPIEFTTTPFEIKLSADRQSLDITMTLVDKNVFGNNVNAVTTVKATRVDGYVALPNSVDDNLTVAP